MFEMNDDDWVAKENFSESGFESEEVMFRRRRRYGRRGGSDRKTGKEGYILKSGDVEEG